MAKKADITKVPEKIGTKEISIKKYFQLHNSGVHQYSRAYLEVQFRGIMKTKESWDKEIKKIMEGDK